MIIAALKVESEYLDEKLENQEIKSSTKILKMEKQKNKDDYVLEKNSFAAAAQVQQAQHLQVSMQTSSEIP